MATKKTIGILTGGGDVPGLNPAIRAVTIRALREGYKVIGIRRGWAGLVDTIRDKKADAETIKGVADLDGKKVAIGLNHPEPHSSEVT